MQPEARKLLIDMDDAAAEVASLARGKALEDYVGSRQLRWAVERGFEIIGEALSQLNKLDAALASRISDYRKIISFRNVLIHGYSGVSDSITWDIIQKDLPVLQRELGQLLAEDVGDSRA